MSGYCANVLNMTDDKHRNWIPYALATAVPVALAVGLWFFSVWFGG